MSEPDGRAARWAGQRERRRTEFVDAAIAAISEHGPEATAEQMATRAGVARTRLYRHFDDKADLHQAIAERAITLISAELAPIWDPHGTPLEMVHAGVRAYLTWASGHIHLYQYMMGAGAAADLKRSVSTHLTGLFGGYLRQFGLDDRDAEPLAFGVVGMVAVATDRWLENATLGLDELADRFTRWIWSLLDAELRSLGRELDPNEPLTFAHPARSARR
jgi:AcrR family transcriptional regulator